MVSRIQPVTWTMSLARPELHDRASASIPQQALRDAMPVWCSKVPREGNSASAHGVWHGESLGSCEGLGPVDRVGSRLAQLTTRGPQCRAWAAHFTCGHATPHE